MQQKGILNDEDMVVATRLLILLFKLKQYKIFFDLKQTHVVNLMYHMLNIIYTILQAFLFNFLQSIIYCTLIEHRLVGRFRFVR